MLLASSYGLHSPVSSSRFAKKVFTDSWVPEYRSKVPPRPS